MFTKNYNDQSDDELIIEALHGNKISLERLIKKHQDYIYNISLKFFLNPDDALDATQEVLIKVITHLKQFKKESSFRTWLYRIALNHFLNTPKKRTEILFNQSEDVYQGLADETTENIFDEAEIEEVRILCSTAMLMCLNREQRLLYIIGEIFGADHNFGAELFNLTPANYRVKLHRAKTDLLTFVSGKCGLINPNNPCRCHKKTKFLIEKGVVDKENLQFNKDFQEKITDIVQLQKDKVSDDIQFNLQSLFRNSPFQIKTQIDFLLNDLVK
jgi:RNA polymerase sigma factor (sigma-70 family)